MLDKFGFTPSVKKRASNSLWQFNDFLLQTEIILLDKLDNGQARAVGHVKGDFAFLFFDKISATILLEKRFNILRNIGAGRWNGLLQALKNIESLPVVAQVSFPRRS
jgi:hypothetical protein